MNSADLVPLVLLMLFSLAFAIGLGLFIALLKRNDLRPRPLPTVPNQGEELGFSKQTSCWQRPHCWLAIKTKSIQRVQEVLRVNNPRPCPLAEGLAGDLNLFIAPPLRGWILVVGSGLPDPAEDVDACFRFLCRLSSKLGEVQLFSANPVVAHHSWIRVVRGHVQRAFSWAGRTIWHQGRMTAAETAAGVACPGYLDEPDTVDGMHDFAMCNVEKVPLIAARWSLDPGSLEAGVLQRCHGIAGEWRTR